MQSCDALFYGDKTGFLAKSTSQPPVLKQKSTSQVTGCASEVVRITSQVVRSTSQVAEQPYGFGKATGLMVSKAQEAHKKHLMRKCTRCLTFTGGETRIRTGDKGFAGLCLTTWPSRHMKKAETNPAEKSWSGLRGSNPRPQPWQGCALPTALSPRTRGIIYANLATNASENMKFMQTFCFGCFFRTFMGLNLALRIKIGMCKLMRTSQL